MSRSALVDHVSVRLDAETVSRIDALAEVIAPGQIKVARSVLLRACIAKGLVVLEVEHKKKS